MNIDIHQFLESEADLVSSLIQKSLMSLIGQNYDEQTIKILCSFYQPEHILYYSKQDDMFTATIDSKIVGTVSLYGNRIRNLFILPEYQGKGIGRILMDFIENYAKTKNIECIVLNSNLSAEGFYNKLGYTTKRNKPEKIGNIFIQTLFMEKRL